MIESLALVVSLFEFVLGAAVIAACAAVFIWFLFGERGPS